MKVKWEKDRKENQNEDKTADSHLIYIYSVCACVALEGIHSFGCITILFLFFSPICTWNKTQPIDWNLYCNLIPILFPTNWWWRAPYSFTMEFHKQPNASDYQFYFISFHNDSSLLAGFVVAVAVFSRWFFFFLQCFVCFHEENVWNKIEFSN